MIKNEIRDNGSFIPNEININGRHKTQLYMSTPQFRHTKMELINFPFNGFIYNKNEYL